MTKEVEQLLQQVMALGIKDRIDFEGRLWDTSSVSSIDSEPGSNGEWEAELENRFQSFENGTEKASPGETRWTR